MRLWITGIGVVSPLARGADRTMDRLLAGERAIRRLSLFSMDGARSSLAAEIAGLTAAEVAPRGDDEGFSRTDAMSVLATREALATAGIDPRRDTVDLILGGSTAGMFETETCLVELSHDPSPSADRCMLSHPLSSTADRVHQALGPFRRVRTVCSACSSGANAILLAAAWLRRGVSDVVVAGGADGLCRLTYAGFSALAAMSPEPCRPFDARRSGLTLGEAAAFLVIEPAHRAEARGAKPIAELSGWASGAEAHHITNPEARGETASRVMSAALAVSGLRPEDVDYINAHGTATPLNDAMEAAAIARALGPEVERVPVSSTKGQIGHTLAAAGAIEAAIAAMSIARGAIPPTAGLEEPDPACRLVHVTSARKGRVRAAISNSFGFGGMDTALLFTEPGLFAPPRSFEKRSVIVTSAATIGPLGSLRDEAAASYVEPGEPPPSSIAYNPADHLDIAKVRRLDRPARLIASAIAIAGLPSDDPRAGAIMGSSFGSVDGTMAFLRRLFDKGPKLASPADFPNLVPSSPVGHASIYHAIRGVVLSVSDLAASAESSFCTAIELVAAGESDAIAAGSVEEASLVIDRAIAPVCSGVDDRGPRSEGVSVIVFESEESASARGARSLARVLDAAAPRGGKASIAIPPGGRAEVFTGRDDAVFRAAIEGSSWERVPVRAAAPRAGDHEGAGGFAAAAAIARLAKGEIDTALVVGIGLDRAYALVLGR